MKEEALRRHRTKRKTKVYSSSKKKVQYEANKISSILKTARETMKESEEKKAEKKK